MNLDKIHKLSKNINLINNQSLNNISLLELKYLYYCYFRNNNIIVPANYSFLKEILKENMLKHEKIINNVISNVFKDMEFMSIRTVIDIGAGHTGWFNIIKRFISSDLYPDLYIFLDKDNIDISDMNYEFIQFVNEDIFDWLNSFKGNHHTLLIMSEFLHCKKDNINILKNPEVLKCNILINELSYNKDINERLKQTGGEIIPDNLISNKLKNFRKQYYKTMFDYYMGLYIP